MLINLNERIKAVLLGDAHLGRKFTTGVPSDRIGHREALQFQDFLKSLDSVKSHPQVAFHIQMGDIFDKAQINPNILLKTARAYIEAAENHRHVTFIVIQGNHDASKDMERVSSYELFRHLTSHVHNIIVTTHQGPGFYVVDLPPEHEAFVVFPYNPVVPAVALAEKALDYLAQRHQKLVAAFGHWDLDSFSKDVPNLCPHDLLFTATDRIYTGHVHNAEVREFEGGSKSITVTGSMQPYSFGEDAEGEWYVTLDLNQLRSAPEGFWKDKCLRVVLKPGEELPTDVDCLQIIPRKENSSEGIEEIEVQLMDFKLDAILKSEMDKSLVSDGIQSKVMEKLNELTELTFAAE